MFLGVLSLLYVLPCLGFSQDCSTYGAEQHSFTYGDVCLRSYASTTQNWQAARDFCRAWHPVADLPVVHSYADLLIVWNMIQQSNFWLGLTDAHNEGWSNWKWVDGSPVDYTRWRWDQPNNCCGGQDCAELYWTSDLTWNDNNCNSDDRRTFCQFYLADILLTEPSNPQSNVRCVQNECWCDWNVDTCPEPYGTCDGVHYLSSAPLVCNGHGDCTYDDDHSSTSTCDCDTDFMNSLVGGSCVCEERRMGVDCDTPVECYGLPWTDGGVCGGHGQCYNRVALGQGIICDCDDNWANNAGVCDDFKCVDGNWALGGTSECSGHGTCSVFNPACVCTVPTDYGGTYCQYAYCWGVRADQGACSGNGDCIAPNNCNCYNNWADRIGHCDDYKCEDGLWVNGQTECGGHGSCTSSNPACSCWQNWADNGGYCNDYKCEDGTWVSLGTECSGHGGCNSFDDNCNCVDNWADNGGYCNDYRCQDNVWVGTGTECSGHGWCTSTSSTCNCVDNWDDNGGYCNDYRCEDNLWDLTGASCSGNGNCGPTNPTCNCDNFWEHRLGYCDDYKCEDNLWDGTGAACSTHGGCLPTDRTCNCDNNWENRVGLCDDYKCEDNLWNLFDPLVCNGNGRCYPNSRTCDCDNNWENRLTLCDDYKCEDNLWDLTGASCSTHGDCGPTDRTCNCDNNWENRVGYCDDYKCEDNLWDLTGASCSTHGSCGPTNRACSCDNFWEDRVGYCDDYKCEDNQWDLTGASCSTHGNCGPTDRTCSCDQNWANQGTGYCNDYKCEDSRWRFAQSASVCSGNGLCSSSNAVCQCDLNWDDRADYCDDYQCVDGKWKIFSAGTECSGHGTCSPSNSACVCDAGYVGTECEYPVCDGLWSNNPDVCNGAGNCVLPDTCNCLDPMRYEGTFCETPVCVGFPAGDSRTCNGEGTCHGGLWVDPYCNCNEHHYGLDCESDYVCYGKVWSDADACTTQTRGDCRDADNNCVCFEGYSGNECEYYVCNDIHGYEPYVCSGQGDCVEVDECDCTDTYKGEWCQYKSRCGNYDFDNYLVCRSRGDCRRDTCFCEPGYTGDDCEITVCFGLPSDSDYVCGGQPALPAGICWNIDSCMCLAKFYGRECTEYFPDSTVVLQGITTDEAYSFFVSYIPQGLTIPDVELPTGTRFSCGLRLMSEASVEIVGEDALCSWRNSGGQQGILVDVSKTAPIVSMERAELEFYLLSALVQGMGAWIDVVVEIEEPRTFTTEVGFFTPAVQAIFVIVVLFIILLALVVVGFGIAIFLYRRKKDVIAQEALLEKMATMDGLTEGFAKDRAKLELAIRLQALKAEKPAHLPETFVQLTGLDDENKVVMLQPMGQCSVWRRASLTAAVFMGHKVVARTLDDKLKAVNRSCVNRLVARAANWAEVPPYPRLRRFHAFYVEGQEIGVLKAEASGVRLLQSIAEAYDQAREDFEDAPHHAILIEGLAGVQPVFEYMRRKRREAISALPVGVLIRTATLIEEKVKWLMQIVDGFTHLVYNGVVLKDFTLKSVLLVGEDRDVVLDMPFLNREPLNSRFVAPEVVLDVLKRKGPEIGPASGVYSLAIIMYCLLAETTKPYSALLKRRKTKTRSKDEEVTPVGQRVAEDPNFRPPIHPWLPDWSCNLLRKCWSADPEDRLTLEELYSALTSIHLLLLNTGDSDDEEFCREDPVTDSSEWDDLGESGEDSSSNGEEEVVGYEIPGAPLVYVDEDTVAEDI